MDRGRWTATSVDDGRRAAEDGSSSLLRHRRWTVQGDGDRRQQRSGGSGNRSRCLFARWGRDNPSTDPPPLLDCNISAIKKKQI
ncbi:hypothetical protein MRB53_021003 [Persea americana]|uniref:Uncharacterized protein n=1 Tax=Persea americana TaxID=3435 RepID=A0ACC2L3F0_PERAE|nr:hypothetical protein MRB53_021003 [Persea americana]